MLTNLTVSEFAAKLSSKSPAPGGGSAAALSGLLGVSALEMAICLSIDQADLSMHRELLSQVQIELKQLHGEVESLINQDAQAFAAVIAAFALPKNTQQEKAVRTQAVQAALQQAAQVPLKTAGFCLLAMKLAKKLVGRINAHVISDLSVGVQALHTGIIGSLLNTAINIAAITDITATDLLKEQLKVMRKSGDELLSEIQQNVYGEKTFAVMKEE